MAEASSSKDSGTHVAATSSRDLRDGEDNPGELMRFGFKYGNRVSAYEFTPDGKKHMTILVDDSFKFGGILIDADNPNMEILERLWKLELFQNMFSEELFVEMFVYKGSASEESNDKPSKSQELSKANIRKLYNIQNHLKFEDFFTHLSNLESEMSKNHK